MKTVSVIVPVYRVEKYIAATVQSVLDQTYPHLELILVDDGSPDQVSKCANNFKAIGFASFSKENRGANAARNRGIRESRGEYIAFIDGDDLWLPEKLAKHIEHLETSPHVGLSFSRSAFIDEAGAPLGIYQLPKLKDISKPHYLCRNPVSNGSASVIRREAFEAIKYQGDRWGETEDCYWDESLKAAQDFDCWLRIICQTDWQLEGIPEALTLYRVNSGGTSANLFRYLEAWEQVIEKARGYDPELIAQWGDLARAYCLRYLARRAVTLKAGAVAVELLHKAIAADRRLLLEEPRRTVITAAAAYLLRFLPQSIYRQTEALALKMTGARQRKRIQAQEAKG